MTRGSSVILCGFALQLLETTLHKLLIIPSTISLAIFSETRSPLGHALSLLRLFLPTAILNFTPLNSSLITRAKINYKLLRK